MRISRQEYVELFGPTVGDRVRLGDTDLWVEVERDYLVPGDECVFGGGKTLRDGLGIHGGVTAEDGVLDFVITNALVIEAAWATRREDVAQIIAFAWIAHFATDSPGRSLFLSEVPCSSD